MNRFQEHLDRIGGFDLALTVAIACGIVSTFLVFVIPSRYRAPSLLVLLSFCQAADKFEALGTIATLCKLAVAPLAILLAMVAFFEFRGQVRLSAYFTAWLVTAMWGVICVLRVPDAAIALPISITWLLMVVAGGMLSYTITSEQILELALKAMCIGSGLGGLVALFALTGNEEVSKEYVGRFSPFGANPNQIAMSFMLTVVIGYYFFVNVNNIASKIGFGLFTSVSAGELVLTFSRAAIAISLIALSPLLIYLSRRPITLILLCILTVPVVFVVAQGWESQPSSHLYASLERAHHWELGMREIEKRPFLGLFWTNTDAAIDKGWNAHNAFIQLMYTGGVALALPTCLLYLLGLGFGVRVYLRGDPVFRNSTLTFLVLLQALLIAHGLVNDALFYPTYSSSFTVVVLCFFFRRQYFHP